MLYKLIYFFHTEISSLNVFATYVQDDSGDSLCARHPICFRRLGSPQTQGNAGGSAHPGRRPGKPQGKAGTPTMGGCLILPVVIVTTLLWEKSAIFMCGWCSLFFALSVPSLCRRLLENRSQKQQGLSAKTKFTLQILGAFVVR